MKVYIHVQFVHVHFFLYMNHNMNQHVATVHEEKKHSIVKFVITNLLKMYLEKKMFHEFLTEISHSNVMFVTTDLPERVT